MMVGRADPRRDTPACAADETRSGGPATDVRARLDPRCLLLELAVLLLVLCLILVQRLPPDVRLGPLPLVVTPLRRSGLVQGHARLLRSLSLCLPLDQEPRGPGRSRPPSRLRDDSLDVRKRPSRRTLLSRSRRPPVPEVQWRDISGQNHRVGTVSASEGHGDEGFYGTDLTWGSGVLVRSLTVGDGQGFRYTWGEWCPCRGGLVSVVRW